MKPHIRTFKHCRNQAGLTLVELMIAMTLGLILMAAVIEIFIGSKQSYRVTDNTSRVQENGRYATNELSKDIRMAGYLGCAKNAAVNNIAQPTTNAWIQFNQAIIGYASSSIQTGFGVTSAEVLSGTDVIQIQHASNTGATVKVNYSDNAQIKILGNTAGFEADQIIIVSDCSNADIFRANSVSTPSASTGQVTITHSSATNTTNFLSKIYNTNAEVLRLVTDIYYVGSGVAGANGDICPLNTLCRKSLDDYNLEVEQLVDNVEGLTFLYGEDTDSDGAANKYVAAASVGTWANVVSVRYAITIRTPEDNLATATTALGDKRIRRTFGATVAVRNNIP